MTNVTVPFLEFGAGVQGERTGEDRDVNVFAEFRPLPPASAS